MCSGKLEAPGGTSNSDEPSFWLPAWRPIRDRFQVNGGLSCSASEWGSKTLALMRATVPEAGRSLFSSASVPDAERRRDGGRVQVRTRGRGRLPDGDRGARQGG